METGARTTSLLLTSWQQANRSDRELGWSEGPEGKLLVRGLDFDEKTENRFLLWVRCASQPCNAQHQSLSPCLACCRVCFSSFFQPLHYPPGLLLFHCKTPLLETPLFPPWAGGRRRTHLLFSSLGLAAAAWTQACAAARCRRLGGRSATLACPAASSTSAPSSAARAARTLRRPRLRVGTKLEPVSPPACKGSL